MEDLLLTLKRIAASLPKKQKAIAIYILENPDKAKSINLKELCQVCHTTEPVVFALCYKLGVSSFSELKTGLALSVGAKSAFRPNAKISKISDEDLLSVPDFSHRLEVLAHHYTESIADTVTSIDHKEFESAIKLLKKADKVLLIGVGTSGNVGHLMLQAFIRTGLQINWTNDPNMFITYLLQMKPSDVCIVLSQTGSQRDILSAVETSRSLKVKTILISANPHKHIKELVDIHLATGPAPSTANTHISIVSRLALPLLLVLDVLVASLMIDAKAKFLKDAEVTAEHNSKRLL